MRSRVVPVVVTNRRGELSRNPTHRDGTWLHVSLVGPMPRIAVPVVDDEMAIAYRCEDIDALGGYRKVSVSHHFQFFQP